MDSLSTFNACLHPAPIKCGTRRFSSTINIQSRRCLNFSERASYQKTGSLRQLCLPGFEDGSGKRSISQVIKASEAEATLQNETSQEEVKKESEEVASQTEEKAAEKPTAVAEAKKDVEEGGATGKYWVLRSAGEVEGRSQEIIPGDDILIGAAPNVTGSAKPFVVDMPMVSSSHARVYAKDRRSYQKTVHEYFVMDLGSTNGTYLNRSKLRPQTEVKLSRGDILKFGDERATFVVEAQV